MFNKKSISIFVALIIVAYVGAYFYTAGLINKAVIKKLDVNENQVQRSGFPFSFNFNIKDHEQYKSVSFVPFSKKIDIELNSIPSDFENLKYKKTSYKELKHLRFSAKLESFFELFTILKDDIADIDVFNLTNDYQIAFKAITDDPALVIDSEVSLSFPDKRNYKDSQDVLGDFPRYLTGSLKYNIDSFDKSDSPAFIKRIFELTYPEKAELHFDAMSASKVDLTKKSFPEMLMTLLNLDLKFKGKTDTNLIKSEALIDLGSQSSVYHAKMKATENYKGDALKKLYESLNKDDLIEFVLLAMHNMEMQLNDNTKSKISMLISTIWDRYSDEINKNPNYWDSFYNLRTNYIVNVEVPYNEAKGDAKILIHIPNDTGEFEFKLDGKMVGGLSAESAFGQILIQDKEGSFGNLIGYGRLLVFALDQKINSDEFKNIIDNFEIDTKLINTELKRFSDDDSINKGPLYYSYNINMKNPMASTINKKGNNLMEFFMFLGGVFAKPEMEQPNVPSLEKSVTPLPESEIEKIVPPVDEVEGQDL